MSDTKEPAREKKWKRSFWMGGLLLLVGGASGLGLHSAGALPLLNSGLAEPEVPELVRRDGVSVAAARQYYSPTGDKRPDPTKFKVTYYPLDENFTSNLGGSGGFVQLGLGVSTYYDERVLGNVELHEMAIRSAVLLALSEQDAAALAEPQGKEALKAVLRQAINEVLKKKEGFGGIDDVYFTSFVVQ